MENLEGYRSRIQALSELVSKLERGEMSVDELSEMEMITRELHERSIILRYNVLREKAGIVAEPEVLTAVEDEVTSEPIAEEEPMQEEAPVEPTIDFSIFDEETQEETPVFDLGMSSEEAAEVIEEVKEEVAPEPEPIVEPEPEPLPVVEQPKPEPASEPTSVVNHDPAPVEEEPIVEEEIEEPVVKDEPVVVQSQGSIEALFVGHGGADNSIASRFSGGKLDTLIGAFGLNQRLRYINDLFDGSSELFSDAIKVLDSQSSYDLAKQKVAELAGNHAWDPEEEAVIEFVSYVNRRYA